MKNDSDLRAGGTKRDRAQSLVDEKRFLILHSNFEILHSHLTHPSLGSHMNL